MSRYKCPGCDYIYDESKGDKHEGIAAGTAWNELPEDWSCPDCAVEDKINFINLDDVSIDSP